FWLMKSEPAECSIDDALAAPGATVPWTGVRNYQALRKTRLLGLPELRAHPGLADLRLPQRGNRLSILPVSPAHWALLQTLLAAPDAGHPGTATK
ncbi:MAG: EVE domain-containing protein, partial [Rhodoferax sp.]|nr:EVE domain-containing protein [Rhodoferax sp.]